MKRILSALILLILFVTALMGQENSSTSTDYTENSKKNENTITAKKDYTTEYWLFGSIPAVVVLWGIGSWGWGTASVWHVDNDGWALEQDSYTGGADKVGHMWGIYAISRMGSYSFEKSGDSRIRGALKGFLFGQLIGLGIEVGDGFGDTYGYAWGDTIWNLGGGLIALLFDLFPPIDNLIGFQIEYWPSEDHINQSEERWIEVTSDVTGQKFIFALKFSGIPYIRNTFFQYFQIDFGFYTRGYWFSNSTYDYKTRHLYIGFAINLGRASERALPRGNWRSAFSTFFKYYHPPIAYNPECWDRTLAGREKNEEN